MGRGAACAEDGGPLGKARQVLRKRWNDLSVQELSGSMGDLGTFLPLLLNLAAFKVVAFSPALFWAGFYNVVTGLAWDTPMPVQPMKTIAAVALSTGDTANPGLTPEEAIGAGLSVSAIVFVLGSTGLIEIVNFLIPQPIVRGLQLGLGLSMVKSALDLAFKLPWLEQADCGLLALLSTLFILVVLRFENHHIPAALILTVVGFIIAGVEASGLVLEPTFPPVYVGASLRWDDVWQGFIKAGLAQLPLTTLNSVVSVVDLNNKSLFPAEPAKHITRRSVASSVGLMNLTGLWFGAMSLCHGAGGLAGQYRFGARSGSALLFLGAVKMLIAALLGDGGSTLLQAFPTAILSPLLAFAGLGLALNGMSSMLDAPSQPLSAEAVERRKGELFVVLVTGAVTAARRTGWGFLAGVVTSLINGGFNHVFQAAREKLGRHWQKGSSSSNEPPTVNTSPTTATSFDSTSPQAAAGSRVEVA